MSDNNDNFFDVYGQDPSANDLQHEQDKVNDLNQHDMMNASANNADASANEAMTDDAVS